MTAPLFDATTVPPSTGDYEPVPNNRYLLQVVWGEMKPKPDEGKLGASVQFKVMEGEQEGRTFFVYYNLQHPNQDTQKRGQRDFSALCHASGVLQPRTIAEFENRPFYGDVVVTKPNGEYGPGNNIRKYYKPDGSDMKGVVGTIPPTPSVGAPAPVRKGAAPDWVAQAKAS